MHVLRWKIFHLTSHGPGPHRDGGVVGHGCQGTATGDWSPYAYFAPEPLQVGVPVDRRIGRHLMDYPVSCSADGDPDGSPGRGDTR